MIYSRKHRFAYIKGRKVASTSIEIALSTICGEEDIITPITPVDERARLELGGRPPQNYGADPISLAAYINSIRAAGDSPVAGIAAPPGALKNHSSLRELLKFVGPVPDDILVFASERSPYMKVISSANLRASPREYNKTGARVAVEPGRIRTAVDRMIADGTLARLRNYRLYIDEHRKLRAVIVRQENLEEELRTLFASRGIPALPPLPHAKRGLFLSSSDVREYLTPDQIHIINNVFGLEFTKFGYEMIHPSGPGPRVQSG